jgi:ribose transport system ATP-binding protein
MVELDADPKANIASLSIAKKQLIQIAKALATNAAYLILDEPTSSLTEKESETLFSLLGGLKAKGVSILFVSHKLEEVLAICDRISVIRDGNMIATVDRESVTKESIISMMIGRAYFDSDALKGEIKPGETMLEAVGICKKGLFKNVDFNVRSGEIVGFYGLVGAGRTEIARCVIGDYLIDSGEIRVGGKAAQIKSISDSFSRYKIGYITENRKEGIFLKKSNRWNISIAAWKKMRGKVLKTISSKKERALCDDTVRDLSIKISGLSQRTEELSGGNQQKISFAKWLAAGCDILIIDEPTIGVDVMAKDVIHALIWKLAVEKGKTIVLITSDLDELLKLAMRIYVVRDGAIVGKNEFQDPRSADKQRLSNWIGQLLT